MVYDQLAWYIAGPALGLCVVACRLLFNARLGITGGFAALLGAASRRSLAFGWRGWFAIGVLAGGTAFALVGGGAAFHGYGWLTETFTGSERFWIGPILLAAGVLLGFGARLAGGCTAGNGLSGISVLSPASFVATATFFATAIGTSFAIEAVT